jgi:hypothetical protein
MLNGFVHKASVASNSPYWTPHLTHHRHGGLSKHPHLPLDPNFNVPVSYFQQAYPHHNKHPESRVLGHRMDDRCRVVSR